MSGNSEFYLNPKCQMLTELLSVELEGKLKVIWSSSILSAD